MKRATLTFQERYKLGKWLEALGQEAIDKGVLSTPRLAKMATKELGISLVTSSTVKKMLVEVGMRPAAELQERTRPAVQKNAAGPHPRSNEARSDELAAAVKDLTSAVRLMVQLLERKLALEEQKLEQTVREAEDEELNRIDTELARN